MKVKFSGKDSKGKIYTDCSECERGGNGNAVDKCASGHKITKGKKGMCFMGELMDKYESL